MRGEKELREALPTLSAEELRMVWKDVRRAADIAAIGGASSAQWMRYVNAELAIKKEICRRFPEESERPIDFSTYWTPEEEKRLVALWQKIMKQEGGAQ